MLLHLSYFYLQFLQTISIENVNQRVHFYCFGETSQKLKSQDEAGTQIQQCPNKTKHLHLKVLLISVITHNLKYVSPETAGSAERIHAQLPWTKCNPRGGLHVEQQLQMAEKRVFKQKSPLLVLNRRYRNSAR